MNLRTVAILRGYAPDVAAGLAADCWDIGIDLVEVPAQGDAGWAALEAVLRRADGRPVGAGTVLTPEAARRAVGMGASVMITPGIDAAVIETTLELGALPLPGVMTATDVGAAARLGVQTCKLFPASLVGPAWLPAMRGPFPSIAHVAVGGIDASNAMEYLEAGAAGVAFGSSIEGVLALEDPPAFVASLHDAVTVAA